MSLHTPKLSKVRFITGTHDNVNFIIYLSLGDDQSAAAANLDSDVHCDISLTISQGHRSVFNCFLKIIKEFNSRYLECKQLPYAQAHTVCTVIQLLHEHHQIMETSEILQLTKSIITFVQILGSSFTYYRKCELLKLKPGNILYTLNLALYF